MTNGNSDTNHSCQPAERSSDDWGDGPGEGAKRPEATNLSSQPDARSADDWHDGPGEGAKRPEATTQLRRRAAFEATRAEREAIAAGEVAHVNLEIVSAVITAIGSFPKIAPYRSMIVSELAKFPIRYFDELENYANAAGHAQTLYLIGTHHDDLLQAWTEELAEKRTLLHADLSALTKRGLIDPERIANLRGAKGVRNIAQDVLLFCELLREEWANVSQRTAATLEEIAAAEQLAEQALAALGVREQSLPSATPESDARARAFTLFVNAYDQVRRAMSYLRWNEGDVDSIIPSLYAGRNGGHRSSSNGEQGKAAEPAGGAANAEASEAAPAAPVAPGMPGAPPFLK